MICRIQKTSVLLSVFIAVFFFSSLPLSAFTVASPFGTWQKIIVGDEDLQTSNTSIDGPLSFDLTDQNLWMEAVGDGSWKITFNYAPGTRIDEYRFIARKDSTTAFQFSVLDEDNQGSKKTNVTIPNDLFFDDTYVIYNNFGSSGARGLRNGPIGTWTGSELIGANAETRPVDNVFNMRASSESGLVRLLWDYSGNPFPDVETADTVNAAYGFKIFRAGPKLDTPSLIEGVNFIDITDTIVDKSGGNGPIAYAGGNGIFGFEHSIIDTDVVNGETYIYTIFAYDAYGSRSDSGFEQTQPPDPGGGRTITGSPNIPKLIIFLVLGYQNNKIFPDNKKYGNAFLTPVYDGTMDFFHKKKAKLVKVSVQ